VARRGSVRAVVQAHLDLDEAFEEQLAAVVADTEQGATNLHAQVSALDDAATFLIGRLERDGAGPGNLEGQIAAGADAIERIMRFLEELPDALRSDVTQMQRSAADELESLGSMLETVSDVARQSKVLAINAGVIAANAGASGRGFAVVAHEMRQLAERSADASSQVDAGLRHTQRTMKTGMQLTHVDAQIEEARGLVQAIGDVQRGQQRMAEFYRETLQLVRDQSQQIATEIGGLLAQIQGQDVVRQRIERLTEALAQRNEVLADLPGFVTASEEQREKLAKLTERLGEVLETYRTTESRHAAPSDNGAPAFELF
jgi:methyl-accepting chemotaxis protein